MKILSSCFLIILAIGVLTGTTQGPAEATPLKNVSQIFQLYYENADSTWKRILPNGNIQTFALDQGQSFVMTGIYIRFYADTTNSGPYRFFLKAPNGTRLWITMLDNIQYPTSGATVYGGGRTDTFNPGLSISVLPTYEVRQLPVPPNDPNSGPVIPGTFYGRLVGYVVP